MDTPWKDRMNPSSADTDRPLLEVRGPRTSSVIVHRIAPGHNEVFLEWQRGITRSAESFPGYQGTEVYPPEAGPEQEWVVVIHFDNPRTLQEWLDSPVRAEWTAKLPREIQDYRLKTLPAGFGAWFLGIAGGERLPHWKMALAVLVELYPTVMLLTLFVAPHLTSWFGLAVAMLIGNALSVAILEWFLGPALNRVLAPWLRANDEKGRTLSMIGLLVILGVLGVLTLVFRLMTG